MEFGIIERKGLPIDLEEWTRVVDLHQALVPAPFRTGINPFTGLEVEFDQSGVARCIIDQTAIGNACLQEGRIMTTGIPRSICEEIALALDAMVYEDDRS